MLGRSAIKTRGQAFPGPMFIDPTRLFAATNAFRRTVFASTKPLRPYSYQTYQLCLPPVLAYLNNFTTLCLFLLTRALIGKSTAMKCSSFLAELGATKSQYRICV